MAHKTFISYKYSEAKDLRNRIIKALGDDATFYQGETNDSPNLNDESNKSIKKKLSDMMYDTSVTIVVISPNMKESNWIEWEIKYCLKNISRRDRTSHKNGIVGVIMKYNGGYDWFKMSNKNADGCMTVSYKEGLVYKIINDCRYNQNPKKYCCNTCKSVNALKGSYISYVEEETFLKDPNTYIDNAYEKSENDGAGYDFPEIE